MWIHMLVWALVTFHYSMGIKIMSCHILFAIRQDRHADHYTVVILPRQFGFRHFSCFKVFSHHVQFIHLITDKLHKMLGFQLIFVHQIHSVSFNFKSIIMKL